MMAKKLNISNIPPKIVLDPVALDEKRYIRCRVLIVCEGLKTEPNYFKSFSMMKNSSGLVYDVCCDGGSINTIQVVDKAIQLRDKAIADKKPYDSVWAVFDKDNFLPKDFNAAILKAQSNNIGCAWSNEAFELWYVYHFDDRCTPMSRTKYERTITDRVKARGYTGKKAYVYKKNDPKMREVLSFCQCDEHIAINRAERQHNSFTNQKFHEHNPCTTVYKLVRLLIGEDKDFNETIKNSIANTHQT